MAANPRAVMRALKATAPAPSMGGYGNAPAPYIGPGPSPLVASYNQWDGGHGYGTNSSLPRDWRTFLSGMFGPLAPIQPVPIDTPGPGEDRPEPRRYQYEVGQNMPMGMPGTEGAGKLASFQTLRTIADWYSVARSAIELRKNELRGVGWDIAPTRQAAKAMRGDHKAMVDFAERRAKVVKFFLKPDPNYADFTSWFTALLEEFFVTDAISLYLQPPRIRGKGLLGRGPGALDCIDGTLIKPLVDVRGGTPAPPNPGYQQFEYGVPRVDLMSVILDEDGTDQGTLTAEYRGDQLMYLPYTPRVWTKYGQAPVERALIPIMMGLNKQNWQLDFYKEGSIPGIYVSPGDTAMTASQLRELQDALNAIAGDVAWKHKVIVLPGGSKVDPQKGTTLADDFDLLVQTQTVMAFDVAPFELGIIPQITTAAAASSGAARQAATAQMDLWKRKSTIPTLLFFKSVVFDRVIQGLCGQMDMEWAWEGLTDEKNIGELTPALVEQVGAGLASIDEARLELGREPWNLPITSDPGWATQWGGLVPLTGVTEATAQPLGGSPGPGGAGRGSGMSSTLTVPTGDPGIGAPAPTPPGTVPRNRMSTGQRRDQARQVTTTQNRTGSLGTPAHSGARGGAAASARATGSPGGTPARGGAKKTGAREVIEAVLLGNQPPALEPSAVLAAGDVPEADLGDAAKAARELGLLRSHLRRGEPVTAWQPRYIPPRLLSQVAEHMAKGMTADGACSAARAMLGEDPVAKDAEGHVTCGQGHKHWGRHGAAGLLIRAKGQDGRWRYLLHKRGEDSDHPGAWGIPGGALHEGEMPEMAAIREATEELGVLPALRPSRVIADDHGGWIYHSVLVDSPGMFQPSVDGSTSRETGGWAWMTAAEIGAHPGMHPGFADSFAAVRRARRSKTITKATDLPVPVDGEPVKAKAVLRQLRDKFPPAATAWVKDATWIIADVPFADVDFDDETSWSAHHQQDRVKHFSHLVHTGQHVPPPVMVQVPNKAKVRIVDGHHRVLGARQAKHDVIRAYVGTVRAGDDRWSVTHSSQARQGHDPMNKASFKVPKGLVGYRDAAGGDRRCGTCSMFRPGGDPGHGLCTLVEGPIRAGAVCDRWDRGDSAAKTTAGYTLNPRSGMVSLDIPAGTIPSLPGGVTDHHVTVVYLGPDVDDDAFALACDRAAAAASMMAGPLTGMLGPLGTFPPSESSDGKTPLFLHAHLPGAGKLRDALADLSADEHTDWHPHCTLTYQDDGDPQPEWAAPEPVTFTHLSVHRGGDVRRYPLGGVVGKSERTPYVSTVHNPLGHEGLWHTPDKHVPTMQQLPSYHQNTARALMRDEGMSESRAIATAVNAIREWKRGYAFGGKVRVTPQVQAAAAQADAEWEKLKASHH